MTQALEHLLPRFGRANSQAPNHADNWGGDTDNFDVDMLTEYLLDDGNLGNVTFDFNMDQANQGSSLVSPGNSEDGNMPPVADSAAMVGTIPQAMITAAPALLAAAAHPGIPGFPLAGGTFPSIPNAVPTPANMANELFKNAQKRRRLDGTLASPAAAMPMMAMAAGGAPILTAPQLAAAAAQLQQQSHPRGRKKSQAQVDRRRERNRILARRTRLRKKFFFESLQKEVMDLQKENLRLKEITRMNLEPSDSKMILDECDAMEKMPESVLEECGEYANEMDSKDFNLVSSIQRSQHSFIITDPSLQDNPIVFASDDFLKLTGYKREQVLGRNCRFLQGSETCKKKVEQIRKQLANGDDVNITLLNYRTDGTPFWNKLFVAALRDAQSNIVNYIGVTVEVAAPVPGDPEHGKALPITKSDDKMDETDDDGDADDTVLAIEGDMEAAVAATK